MRSLRAPVRAQSLVLQTRTKTELSQLPVPVDLKDAKDDEDARARATNAMNEQFLAMIKGPIKSIEDKKANCASRPPGRSWRCTTVPFQ